MSHADGRPHPQRFAGLGWTGYKAEPLEGLLDAARHRNGSAEWERPSLGYDIISVLNGCLRKPESMPSFLSRLSHRPSAPQPELSIVVVAYNMRREILRTVRSLSIPYQRNIARKDYEIILLDNGSEQPATETDFADLDVDLRLVNLRNVTSSPVPAVNRGLQEARGELIGVWIYGARMVTPGLLDAGRRAARLYPRPIVATLGFHLGFEHQAVSVTKGYTREVEDRLLRSVDWPRDGYRLLKYRSSMLRPPGVGSGPSRRAMLCLCPPLCGKS